MSISIRRITCREAWENPSWKTIVEQYRKDLPNIDFDPDPDESLYLRYELAGLFFCIGAFDGDSLVGLVSFAEITPPLKKGVLVARSELLWVDPLHRGEGLSKRLMESAVALAKSHGCLGFFWSVRYGTTADRILRKAFGDPSETVFWQSL